MVLPVRIPGKGVPIVRSVCVCVCGGDTGTGGFLLSRPRLANEPRRAFARNAVLPPSSSLHRDVRGSAVRRPRGVRGPPGSRGGPAGLPPRPAGGPWRAARRRSSPLARTGSRGRGPLRRRRGRGGAPAGGKNTRCHDGGARTLGKHGAADSGRGREASRRRHGPRREFPGAKAVAAAAGNRFRERRRTNPERAPRTAGRPRLASARRRGTRGFARPPPFPGAKAAISPVARTRARAREASRAARPEPDTRARSIRRRTPVASRRSGSRRDRCAVRVRAHRRPGSWSRSRCRRTPRSPCSRPPRS